MRLFLAINFPAEVKDAIEISLKSLRAQGVKASWSRRENLHLTLEFLGELEETEAVITAMNSVQGREFNLRFCDVGRFQRKGGDIFWLGVEQTKPLMELQRKLHWALEWEGIPLEQRLYRPHLTLARRLRDQGETALPKPLPKQIRVDGFSLMCSERKKGVLCYTELYWRQLEQ